MSRSNNIELRSLPQEIIMLEARKLPSSGILRSNGYYSYLEIDADYVDKLFSLLESDKSLHKPTCKAHISFAYPEEDCTLDRRDIGSLHSFDLLGLYEAKLQGKWYYIITVSAPSLERLRQKYQLPKKLSYKGCKICFHITIAKDSR